MEIHAEVIGFIRTSTCNKFSKISLAFVFFCRDVNSLHPVAIIEPGKFALIAEVVEDLDLIYNIWRKISRRKFWIITKKTFSIYENSLNGFAVRSNRSIFVYLDPW